MAGETVITLVGNLTADPELRYTASGAPVANFTVASTPRNFDRNTGQWQDGDTLFVRCSVWRDVAENVAESLRKGMRVIVQGRLTQRSYETRDGQQRTSIELQVDEIGPSLRRARAQVTRTTSNDGQGGYGGGQGGYSNSGGYGNQGGYSGGNQGGYSPSQNAGYNAAPGGSATDPWSTDGPEGGSTAFGEEPPF
ncbi:MAG: single-stranded DNA-binding protein [Actinomycetaceae bacterium]|nr:single-stranded DNA-binding protein [Actinomycetaceae bacterium]